MPWQNAAMPHRPLLDLVAELRRCAPARRRVTKVNDPVLALTRLLAGCRALAIEERAGGVLVRLEHEDDPRVLFTCVVQHAVPVPLTAVEAAVAKHIGEGRTIPQIARLRGVSVNTIKSQLRQLFRKLEVDSRVALVRRLGL
jgi:DNA-binding NarL/FixJ family response regulator